MLIPGAVCFVVVATAGTIGAMVGFGFRFRGLRVSDLEVEELKRKVVHAEQENEQLRLELLDLDRRVKLACINRGTLDMDVRRLCPASEPTSPLVDVSAIELAKFAQALGWPDN